VQESDSAKKMRDISGRKCCEQLEKFNHVGLWVKMFADLLIGMEGWYSTKCKLIWKLKATKSHRFYFQLAPSMLPIEETGFGLLLLKTPSAMDSYSENLSKKEQKFGNSGTLAQEVQTGFIYQRNMLPTPTAMDSTNATATMKSTQVKEGSMHSVTLSRWANQILPTPVAGEYRDTGEKVKGNNYKQQNLTRTIANNSEDWIGKNSQLNPLFVEEMMGFPPNWTTSPFQNGGKNP
jgi:hypothetical protein